MQLFISNLVSDNPADQFYFFAVVLVVVVSIVLHELAHGWAALRRGDPTPRVQGRMTGNPLVHMGPFSLVALGIAGIAWGQMPIDPTRMRGRHAGAFVAAAGPATNLILAAVTLTLLAVLLRLWGVADLPAVFALYGEFARAGVAGELSMIQQNTLRLLAIAGVFNLVLAVFNLMPAPPLDGSHILADYSQRYRDFAYNPTQPGLSLLLFIGAFMLIGLFFGFAIDGADAYVGWLATLGR
ncbi:MAG: site-2 protease family protein [Planctomycetota bacterium]